jgi:hypothetical protein
MINPRKNRTQCNVTADDCCTHSSGVVVRWAIDVANPLARSTDCAIHASPIHDRSCAVG